MENEELYRRAQAGEAGAFEQLHKQLANFIRSIALESCRHFGCTDVVSASLLEDLCAEGDLELWERIHSGGYDEHAGKLTTYLYPFLRGRMYRYLETNLGVMSLSKDEMERVRQAQRLYHVEGKSAEEIAAALHLSDEATARLVGYNTNFLSVFDLLAACLLHDRGNISPALDVLPDCLGYIFFIHFSERLLHLRIKICVLFPHILLYCI